MEKIKLLRALQKIKRAGDRVKVTKIPLVQLGMSYARNQWFAGLDEELSDGVPVEVDGIRILLPRRFVPHYVQREYEPITRKMLSQVLQPGMVVLDVGAHIGFYALLAARLVGPEGKVHAVEPSEKTVAFLEASIELNGFSNITIHRCAAGNVRTTREFNITGSSDSNGFYDHPNIGTLRKVQVLQVPLDDLIEGRVDVIKIDVEGAEIEVLEGMENILRQNKNIQLLAEWFPAGMRKAGYGPLDLPQRLIDLGFQEIAVIDDNALITHSLEEATAIVSSKALPKNWYANLWAIRTSNTAL
jgi:FkbM family methyltransferase